ncbi:MAG: hypothetical protein U1E36_09230 [Rickettsiales bacterium]
MPSLTAQDKIISKGIPVHRTPDARLIMRSSPTFGSLLKAIGQCEQKKGFAICGAFERRVYIRINIELQVAADPLEMSNVAIMLEKPVLIFKRVRICSLYGASRSGANMSHEQM